MRRGGDPFPPSNLFLNPRGDKLISIKFSEFTLSNGLHVILSPDRNATVIAVDIWYHVGSKNEDPSRTGFAHLFEHMMFQGSANVKKAEHMRYVEEAGGVFNGSTSWDRTNYFETLPANRLELALWLEADRMSSLDVSRSNLNNQREVVKEERRFRVDNRPYGTAWENIFSMAYREHPYRWPVVGYLEHLDAATVDEVRTFFRSYYVPANAVLAVSGDFSPSEASMLVNKYFGDIPSGVRPVRDRVIEKPLRGQVREVIHDDVALPAIYMAFRVPPMTSRDSDALNLAAGLLSRGKSSRLYRRLVYETRIAQSVTAFQLDMEDPGLFVVSAVVSPRNKPYDVEREIRDELRKLAESAPRANELEKIRNQFASEWVRQLTRTLGRADNLAHFRTFYGDTGFINRYLEGLLRVSGRQVRAVASEYLNTENSAVLYYLPREKRTRK